METLRLRAAGWDIAPVGTNPDPALYSHQTIEEFATADGPADYGLVVDA